MNEKVIKTLKLLVPVASLAITLVSNYLTDTEIDEKIAQKIAEKSTDLTKES